jgi:hypothetical protein
MYVDPSSDSTLTAVTSAEHGLLQESPVHSVDSVEPVVSVEVVVSKSSIVENTKAASLDSTETDDSI